MKHSVYCLAFLILLASCSRNTVVIRESDLPEEVFYLPDQIKPYSGHCIIHFTNTGLVKQDMTFKDGKLDGVFISYYRNGNVNRKGEFSEGRYHGKWEQWSESGKKLYEVHYRNDTLCGAFNVWYPTGVLKKKGVCADNNRKGLWTEYDEAGMIVKKRNYN
jgi:antitoxin component YwqK of YwqJK toxin-antitoxin module